MDFAGQNLRSALRSLRRSPAFSLSAIALLAAGLGITSVAFALVDALILRPLPFREPDRLLVIWEKPPGHQRNTLAPANFADYRDSNRTFEAMAALGGYTAALTGAGDPESVQIQGVSPGVFALLGAAAHAGRTLEPADRDEHIAVLSHDLWMRKFGGDPSLIGKTIVLSGHATLVLGVMPPRFQIIGKADIWQPLALKQVATSRSVHILQALGRLKPGVTPEQALDDLSGIAAHLGEVSPATNKGWGVTLDPLRQSLVGQDLRRTTLAVFAATGLLLLMACANLANLQLARGTTRLRELAIRSSLGAPRGQLLALLWMESLLLAGAGGAAGLGVAWAGVRAAPALLPPGILPPGVTVQFDPRLAGFAFGLALLTALAVGLWPAWHAASAAAGEALRAGSRGSAPVRKGRRLLAAAQIAIAVVVLAGASLLARTLWLLGEVDTGYRAEQVLTMRFTIPAARYAEPEQMRAFYRAALAEIEALPGVDAAGLVTDLPLAGWSFGVPFQVAGAPDPGEAARPFAHLQRATPGYAAALGLQLIRGRFLDATDLAGSRPVCVVNEAFVRKHLGGREPLGARIRAGDSEMEIVGVLKQVKIEGPGELRDPAEIYVPFEQAPNRNLSLAVRSRIGAGEIAGAVKAALWRVDRNQPLGRVATMEAIAAESVARPRFRARLAGIFGAFALTLAASGVFAVIAFDVSRRTREMGIRIAVGARAFQVLRLVLGDGLKIALWGIVAGLALASWLTAYLGSLLFAVTPHDAAGFVFAPAVLLAAALAACMFPALRAARVDPAIVLREE
ncbi:MAG: ABC transporter permease [Bryobacteraceae bacterium]|nr:ABC transporter permease [Bryobacteraceae bacterium]